jgi:hypothetical protein
MMGVLEIGCDGIEGYHHHTRHPHDGAYSDDAAISQVKSLDGLGLPLSSCAV